MNRLVYLWELDSVRDAGLEKKNGVLKSDAFKAIFYEIVKNGNSIAVTMNQLTDSNFFAQVFHDEYAYQCVLKLFELGALRVSIYRDKSCKIRTASQYVQNALTGFKDAESRFVFSNFPINREDSDNFKETVLNALKFSDLSELKELLEENKGKNDEFAARLEIIIKFVNIILKLSVCETANVPSKSEDYEALAALENADVTYSYVRFMQEILLDLNEMKNNDAYSDLYAEHGAEIERSRVEISHRMEDMRGRNDIYKRSAWLEENNVKLFSGLSEEIIHICYNLTVEDSINGACEHFDNKSIKNILYLKLLDYYKREKRASGSSLKKVTECTWRMLLRFAEYRKNQQIAYNGVYGKVFTKDRLRWKFFMLGQSSIALVLALIFGVLFCGIELFNNFLEDTFSISMPNVFLTALLNVIIFGILGSILSKILEKIFKGRDIPDLLESIIDVFVHIFDLIVVIIGGKNGSEKLS